MSEVRTLSFYIKPHHAAYDQAKKEASLAKIMKNGITAIARNYYFWKQQGNKADLTISKDFNIDITQKAVDTSTGELLHKDWFNYSANKFSNCEIYSKVRLKSAPDLHSKIAQKIARDASGEWRSYFALLKSFKKGTLENKPKIPGYKRGLYATVPYTKSMLSIVDLRNNVVRPTTWVSGFDLPAYVDYKNVQSARLIPISKNLYRFEILYKYDKNNNERMNKNNNLFVGIDLGLSNLMTIVYSDYRPGYIISGSPIINRLQATNYKIDKMSSFYKLEDNNRVKRGGEKCNNRSYAFLDNLRDKTQRFIKAYYTAVSNRLVEEFCAAGVCKVVIGWSDGFKNNMGIGRLNNRKFMGVPHRVIVDDLKRKCFENNIECVEVEESYTSKSSFFDNDVLPKYFKDNDEKYVFSGSRVSRGLYRTKEGYCVSADLNGAYNIIRKLVPDYEFDKDACMMVSGSVVPRVERLAVNY